MTKPQQPANNGRVSAADEAADRWATADCQDMLSDAQPALPTGIDTRMRAADLRFLHVMLEQIYDCDEAGSEYRIQRVLSALDDQPSEVVPRVRDLTPEPDSISRAATSRFPFQTRWVTSALTLAAGVLVLAMIWAGHNGAEVSAYAAVEQVYTAATSMQDREYRVVSEVNKPDEVVQIESTLFVRGGEKYSIRHPFVLGEIWIGNNGHQAWLVPPVGVAITREESHDNPQYIRRWANDAGFVIPELQLTALIAHLRDQYELELLPSEPLSTTSEALVAAAAQTLDSEQLARTEVMWRRIRGTLNVGPPGRPTVVDVWCHPETGVARRIDLVWRRDTEPASDAGLQRMTVDLVRDHVLDESWYEAAGHPQKKAASSDVE